MTIYVDADACPVTRIVETLARKHGILINLCQKGDIVVTQDYGVAALALGKGAKAIHQSGRWYTDDNIDGLMMERHLAKKARQKSKNHLKGPHKRTKEDDVAFSESFERLILKTEGES